MPRIGPIMVGAIVLTATFASGVVVGRLWARPPLALSSEPSSKPAPGPRRSALAEAEVERARGVEDRLTFYRTLPAPLGPGPATGPSAAKPQAEARPRPPEARAAAAREGARAETRPGMPGAATVAKGHDATPGALIAATAVTEAHGPGGPGRSATPTRSEEPASSWSVQVGVFKGRQQAETAHRRLVEGGLQASLTPTLVGGETRYRVRAGSYRTRAEAERVAERVRVDRALPTYITLD